jgi:hypothetical protein
MRARILPIVLGALVGAMVAVSITFAGEPVRGHSTDLYDALGAAAATGDSDAAAMKADVDQFLVLRGMAVNDLGAPERVVERLEAGPGRLLVEGLAPFVLEARSDPDIQDASSLRAYRALRHAALAGLASSDPTRYLEVFVAPRAGLTVSEFAERSGCSCDVRGLVVDVWGEDGWVMSSGRVVDGLSLERNASALEAELLEQAEVSLGQFGLGRKDVVVTVRQAHLSLSASDAVALSNDPDIYAVDTTADIADALSGRAASIRVLAPPDLFAAYRDFVLKDPIQPGYEPQTKETK